MELDVAVVLHDDELAVVLGEHVELHGFGVQTALELHRQVGDVVAADARLVDAARVDVLLVRRDVNVVTPKPAYRSPVGENHSGCSTRDETKEYPPEVQNRGMSDVKR